MTTGSARVADEAGVDVADDRCEQSGDGRAGERVVGDLAHGGRIGAELRRHLLGDAPGEIVAEHRVLEDVVGQTFGAGRDERGAADPPSAERDRADHEADDDQDGGDRSAHGREYRGRTSLRSMHR